MHCTAGTERNEQSQNGNVQTSSQNQQSLCTQEKLALSSWGLPEKICQHYTRKGITHMFHWQLECLTTGRVLEGGNLVYSAPTSAGKTLVAEILMAQTIFEKNKKVILILPFVSVVREKMFYFQSMFSLNGIKVEGFMGGHSPSAGFQQIHMAVCTIEKANSIINRLLEEKNLNSLGLVVVDELHLLGDSYRGYLLELLLTKLKYMSSKLEINIQIVGMSATLPNLKIIANWLNADLYYSNYRPVPLSEMLKCGNVLFDKKMNKLKEIHPIQSEIPDGPEHIGQLCLETIANGHSVLIFCPSKAWCENLSDEIAFFFKRHGCSKSALVEGTPGYIIRNELNLEKINQVIEHLKMTPVGLDADLQKRVSFGVAFHHAGLTLDERDIIEGSFRNGSIRVLCATSTLSSGVNLPARRVIIRSPMAFGAVMDILTYRQMIGRAGRMGVDSEGESIIICKPNEKVTCQKLMASNLKPIESCLGHGPLSSSLKRALLEIVASGVASTPKEVQEYADCTFLASSSKHDIENPIRSCINFLEENEFIRLQEGGTIYVATPLGHACLASSMPPDEGLSLFRELQRARRCFVLDTDLHVIYQVTPYSVSEQWTKMDWLHVLNVIENLPENMKRVGELVGIEEPFLIRIAKGTLNPNSAENRIKLSIHRRFYTALALQDLVNEVPLTDVAEKYQCNKGTLQSLQQSAATYAGMVTEFTRRLGWGSVELIFSQFQERLQFGVQRDLCELMRLPLLNVIRARALYNKGYTSLVALANAHVSDLENILYSVIPFQSKKEIAGETSFERAERNRQQTIWITGKADLSVRQAAELLVEDSRNLLKMEIGVDSAKWCSPQRLQDVTSEQQEVNNSTIKNAEHGVEISECEADSNNTIVCTSKQFPENLQGDKCVAESDFDIENSDAARRPTTNETCDNSKINNSLMDKFWDSFYPAVDISAECIHTPYKYYASSTERESTELMRTEDFIDPCEGIGSHGDNLRVGDESVNDFHKTINACKSNLTVVLEGKGFKKEENNDCCNTTKQWRSYESNDGLNNHCQIKQVFESDCDSCSNSSVEVLFENHTAPQTSKNELLNGDMFVIQERNDEESFENEKLEKPKTVRTTIDDSNCDLFSQSLTFDTQFREILDFDEDIPKRRNKNEMKRSTSFNSDDLGFVSDCSTPILNRNGINKQVFLHSDMKSRWSPVVRDVGGDIVRSATLSVADTGPGESKLNKTLSRGLKRKPCVSNSPDFIVDSDDSTVDNRHLTKKVKVSMLKNNSNGSELNGCSESFELYRGNQSDDEIMPTPKFNKTRNIGMKNLSSASSLSLVNETGKLSRNKANSDKGSITALDSVSGPKCSSAEETFVKTRVSSISEGGCQSFRKKRNGLSDLRGTWNWDNINITDIRINEDVLESFCDELKLQNIIGLALGCRRIGRERKSSIGLRIKKKSGKPKETVATFQDKDVVLDGVAVYFKGNEVFYICFDEGGDNSTTSTRREKCLSALKKILVKNKLFRLFDTKQQMKLLYNFTSLLLEGTFEDPKTACWLLSKTWKEKSFTSIVSDHIPQATKLIATFGPVVGFSSPGTYVKSSVSPRMRACTEAFLCFHVIEMQLKLLEMKSMLKLFKEVEMPVVPCLAEMELVGFRFDRNRLTEIKESLDLAQSNLGDKAHSFAQHKFPLTSPVAIGKVLYGELKLGGDASPLTRKNRRPSTSKEALQELAKETNHPLPDIILLWRKVQSILSKVLSPLLQIEPEISRIFPVTQTFTSTGRLAMHEPNLQNIPRNFALNVAKMDSFVSVRDVFVPSEGHVLLSVDYCQIELRLLAHLSGDENLIEKIKKSADVFVTIASDIYGVSEYNVDDELRQKAKQTYYGIIYGIGPRALSHQLRVEESIASALMEDFKNKYKGVKKYLEKIIATCRSKGYVTSLCGRRRYLSYINDSNPAIRSEAERQAINTAIQGSAADVIKIAMAKIREEIKAENLLANMLLHLHDELLFEVQQDSVQAAAAVLKEAMESAVDLKVAIPVKLHTGPTWGQLRRYEI